MRSTAAHSRCVHITKTSAVTLQFETTDMHILAQAFAAACNILDTNCVDVMCTLSAVMQGMMQDEHKAVVCCRHAIWQ